MNRNNVPCCFGCLSALATANAGCERRAFIGEVFELRTQACHVSPLLTIDQDRRHENADIFKEAGKTPLSFGLPSEIGLLTTGG
jgi:hypothetical protein